MGRQVDVEEGYVGMEIDVTNFDGEKGRPQPERYKDWTFGILFIFHLGLIFYPFVLAVSSENIIPYAAMGTLAFFATCCALFATFFSVAMFSYMVLTPKGWIKGSLAISLNLMVVVAIIGLLMGNFVMSVTSGVLFALCWAYTVYIYKRIPYVAANFSTAIEVVKSNIGLFIVAFFVQLVGIAWTIVWLISATWAKDDVGLWILSIYFLSYLWVEQVLKNSMHVVTAGIVGEWWQTPGDVPSWAVMRSINRAFGTSFGSICYGSMFVNSFHGMRNFVAWSRDQEGCWLGIWWITTWLFKCMINVFMYMNKWSFVYVGLYGYSFYQGGKNVTILFHNKGWKKLVTDDSTDNILFIINLAAATCTGFVGSIVSTGEDEFYMLVQMYDHPRIAGYTIGFFVGYLISSVLLGVLGGAVNAVIVCFAESPVELQLNHPDISQELRDSWALELPKANSNRPQTPNYSNRPQTPNYSNRPQTPNPNRGRSKSPYSNRGRSKSPYSNRGRSKSPYSNRARSKSPHSKRSRSKSPHSSKTKSKWSLF